MINIINNENEYSNIWELNSLNILQHWNFGEVKRKEGWNILRLKIDNTVIQIQLKNIPLFRNKFGYIPKINNDTYRIIINNIEGIRNLLKENNIHFLILEFSDSNIDESSLTKKYIDHIQPLYSNIIEFNNRKEEEIFMLMDGNYRRNIKKSIREGVIVNKYSEGSEAISNFYNIMHEIYSNTKLIKRNKDYFISLWESFSSKNRANIFIAKKDNSIIGAYLVLNDNNGAYELYGGVNSYGRKLEAGYLLKWESIKSALQSNLKYYDHWGVSKVLTNDNYDNKDELYRISLFKKGFGGKNIKYAEPRVIINNNLIYSIFCILIKINKLLIKFKKLFGLNSF